MATERQIAANRLNAHKSTGPRSNVGKKRASRNAYRHGLTLSLASSAAFAKRLDEQARKIAGDSMSKIILEHARTVAHADLDLARVRLAKVALIERVSALGALDGRSWANEAPYGSPPAIPECIDPSRTMPTREPERTAEAIRRALPELVKLDRYESRAVSRRNRAIREIIKRKSSLDR